MVSKFENVISLGTKFIFSRLDLCEGLCWETYVIFKQVLLCAFHQ
jgi:hypothetical protein